MRQVYIDQTRKKKIMTNNINSNVCRINNNNATKIASLALLPPLQCCLACIPQVVASLARFLARVTHVFSCSCPLRRHRHVPHTIALPPPLRCRVFVVMTMAHAHEYRRRGIGRHVHEWGEVMRGEEGVY